MREPRILEVRTKILKKNDELARQLRGQFTDAGVLVVNLVSSPGTGKTTLLLETLRRLVRAGDRVAAIVGDLETDNDARRLAHGAPALSVELPMAAASRLPLLPMDEIRSAYYLRVMALDRPGVLSQVAGILGRHDISIASVLQKGRAAAEAVPVVMMTHEARERDMRQALAAIDRLSVVAPPTRMIRVETA